jgi:hypothetical protein
MIRLIEMSNDPSVGILLLDVAFVLNSDLFYIFSSSPVKTGDAAVSSEGDK